MYRILVIVTKTDSGVAIQLLEFEFKDKAEIAFNNLCTGIERMARIAVMTVIRLYEA